MLYLYYKLILKTNDMKATDQSKLRKALKMMEKAQQLVNQVEESDSKFNYSSNGNFRRNRIYYAVSILDSEVSEFCK